MFTPGAMTPSNALTANGGSYDPMGFLNGVYASAARRRDRSSVESDDTTDAGRRRSATFSSLSAKPGAERENDALPEAGVTCACCRTQKTPLWRNGPTGAKTLCNACGVRFKNGRIVVDGASGDVIAVPAPGRKRPAPTEIGDATQHVKKHAGHNAQKSAAAAFRGSSFGYKRVHDGRLFELERVGARHAFPRVHSATILTDYDGAVLLMLLHDGDDQSDDEDTVD